jgi:ribosome-associated protein
MTQQHYEKLLQFIETQLEAMKAQDITILPVASLTTVTSYMVIVTGTSTIHVRSIADKLIEEAKTRNIPILSTEGHQQAEWILIDFGGVIVHVMQSSAREYYHLEKLWTLIED